jgi:hypothetical protein
MNGATGIRTLSAFIDIIMIQLASTKKQNKLNMKRKRRRRMNQGIADMNRENIKNQTIFELK